MKKLFWWNLNPSEKAKRSFILIPITGILAIVVLRDFDFSVHQENGIALTCMVLMLIQGLYYKRQARKEHKAGHKAQ